MNIDVKEIIHFGDMWSHLYKEQKAMIDNGSFCGTLDDYALRLGYSSPASALLRNRLEGLVTLGIAEVVSYDEEFYKLHEQEFVNSVIKSNTKYIKCIFIKSKEEIISILSNLKENDFPQVHLTPKKNVDKRKYANDKRRCAKTNVMLMNEFKNKYFAEKINEKKSFKDYLSEDCKLSAKKVDILSTVYFMDMTE